MMLPFGAVGGDQVTLTRYGLVVTTTTVTLVGGVPGTAMAKKGKVKFILHDNCLVHYINKRIISHDYLIQLVIVILLP